MPYTHYGEIGDIWKHLPLCSILNEERPASYVETNAAYPAYRLDRTENRNFGIYYLFEQAGRDHRQTIGRSDYMKLVGRIPGNQGNELHAYLGSPGLAMNMLRNSSRYLFCDIEKEPLQRITEYAERQGLITQVRTMQGDSVDRLWHDIDGMGPETFLHIDPYRIFERNGSGRCYFDLFAKAAERGIKTMLWYGFETLDDRSDLHAKMRASLPVRVTELYGREIYVESIGQSVISVNPGVPGCGILTANLSQASVTACRRHAAELETVYRQARFQDRAAGLIVAEIRL
ncbi:23S rRNA (adenine(2030)-N(6))-methyltransferase RlmJ [Paenibacillus humicola]|uniref:23S rRNA (adenine(2030)-N(6))-methyltransferase RlmJ n=1 Tax=Paenibacillus humicola TaxID=3110540 RepID=UPI00237C0FDF|nr:23S rRNA (adenine(2030)-N(6))-methyltransferase RlmJ [Paenibacillus humicola]